MKKSEKTRVKQLCQELTSWINTVGNEPTILAAFLSGRKIPWKRFYQLMLTNPELECTFQLVCAKLCENWFRYGISNKQLPPHHEKMLIKYLGAYDAYAIQQRRDEHQKAIEERRKLYERYVTDSW